jgi:cytochrome c5
MLLIAAGLGCEGQPRRAAQTGEPMPGSDTLVLAAAKAVLPPPGTAFATLPDTASPGAQLTAKYCTTCHALPHPATHSATDWPGVLRRMWLMTEGVAQARSIPVPTPAERVTLSQYALEHALRVSREALPPGAGRDLFATECSRCHELPDPRQHSSGDWAAIVIRMRGHMEQMLRRTPTQAQIQEIILYLETTRG